VLVIDDESTVGVVLRYAFDAKGHETVVAEDGRSGIELALAEHPDAIVLDLMMPRVNGYDVLDALRDADGMDEVPVLVLTAVALSSERERCFSAGADAVMTKPFDPHDVVEVLDDLLGAARVAAGSG
jgi:two-component system alkaline phosphatase synthesis response regulator PhoP